MLNCEGVGMRPAASTSSGNKGARFTTPPSPSKSSRSSTPSPPRQDLLASVHGLHQHGIFDAKQKLWTRSLALRRGGTVVVAEDYATDDPTADGQWTLFPAAIVLSRYMEAVRLLHPGSAPLVTVELGAGSAVASLVAAALGARAIATDQASVLAYAQRNLHLNQTLLGLPSTGTCVVRPLGWGVAEHIQAISSLVQKPLVFPSACCEQGQPAPTRSWTTLLLGADITYRPESFEILAKTLSHLCSASPGGARVWLAHDDASETQISKESGREKFFGISVPEPAPEPEPEPENEPAWKARNVRSQRAAALARNAWMPGLCDGGVVQRHGFRCRRLPTDEVLPAEWQYPSVAIYELWV